MPDNRAVIMTIYLGKTEAEVRAMMRPPQEGFVRVADSGVEHYPANLCHQIRVQTIDKRAQ